MLEMNEIEDKYIPKKLHDLLDKILDQKEFSRSESKNSVRIGELEGALMSTIKNENQ